ncbi:hypothetical protein cypCar_00006650, partial [Cyprinus carpio]
MAATFPLPVTDSVCYLCTSFLQDRVVLRCCHSLCKICLQSYWELNKSLECPVCLKETHCSVLLHHLSISRFTSEGKSSQDSNFKPFHVGSAESEMQSVEKDLSVVMSTIASIKTEEDISAMVQMLMDVKYETTEKNVTANIEETLIYGHTVEDIASVKREQTNETRNEKVDTDVMLHDTVSAPSSILKEPNESREYSQPPPTTT